MSFIDEEITELSDRWYWYVGNDHHKDRDCHFYVACTWSYGKPPTYQASHHGYVMESWESKEFATELEAKIALRDKLKNEVADALALLRERDKSGEIDEWGWTRQQIDATIAVLEHGRAAGEKYYRE